LQPDHEGGADHRGDDLRNKSGALWADGLEQRDRQRNRRRGRGEPEARLDLHGMTHDGAYRALMRFLMAAQGEDKRLVLVVTGKGGVLRGALPLWLGQTELEPLVSGVSEAHIRHGGSGAFYVSLRRSRRAL